MRRQRSPILLQSQIEAALEVTRSNRAASVYLRVSYNFYKKFAKMYKNSEGVSLFDAHMNKSGKGISKRSPGKSKAIDDILLGKQPNYPKDRLGKRLIANGYKQEKCENCGFHSHRPTDMKVPLTLNFKNGNKTDFRLENLELLCYNCYFILVGDLKVRDLRGRLDVSADRPPTILDTGGEGMSTIQVLSDEEKLSILEELKNL